MESLILNPADADTGIEIIDLLTDPAFNSRRLHLHDTMIQMEALQRLANAFVESPDTILQELVNAAVDLCGADSAGISIEQEDKTDEKYYLWVATAGSYSNFLNATLPRYPSACGVCIERGTPQLFRVTQRFFDIMKVEAPAVTDGILLPWQVEETRGTIWIVSHQKSVAFDGDDLRLMQTLANFAAMGVRQQRQQKILVEQAKATAAAALANELAHNINNPLQSVTNLLYLAREDKDHREASSLAHELTEPVQRLSSLVQEILALPIGKLRSE
ncbi:GAF domain-containing protein [Acidicapsa ligni]|uniref:GAF domain-containing protein n=1 Tax=Acidicapsa ligni TaxID=542300 RepID=UPI0021E05DD5|nr:GAF domain-containing protein [Acidicapsa ligni]